MSALYKHGFASIRSIRRCSLLGRLIFSDWPEQFEKKLQLIGNVDRPLAAYRGINKFSHATLSIGPIEAD